MINKSHLENLTISTKKSQTNSPAKATSCTALPPPTHVPSTGKTTLTHHPTHVPSTGRTSLTHHPADTTQPACQATHLVTSAPVMNSPLEASYQVRKPTNETLNFEYLLFYHLNICV
ncbi:hypothetical protein Pmani_024479 [Petrolisthes manimaculis]|uniref:Uncharacterized protein n=1 Tax=Petrolisthes manimaculis TaxID=1843537 RepID=A0AAE1P7E9_9EUCA|nr:hypothetical protein Pmani_024479 [Petrolisthes manimaculis]